MLLRFYRFISSFVLIQKGLILVYRLGGKKPWSLGYHEYKWQEIRSVLADKKLMAAFENRNTPSNFGKGIDERIVEYGWVFSQIVSEKNSSILDAGSVFNYPTILNLPTIKKKNLTIFTYFPESLNYNDRNISYVYGDLRDMYFRNECFDYVVCQSTLEHIDMDNSIYGYNLKSDVQSGSKSYEYLRAVKELSRVLRQEGTLLLTFPFGKFENHGFFQQFDEEMVEKIFGILSANGKVKADYIRYSADGWKFCEASDCSDLGSYNPHTGIGKGRDGAAHCRAVCCIKFVKKK